MKKNTIFKLSARISLTIEDCLCIFFILVVSIISIIVIHSITTPLPIESFLQEKSSYSLEKFIGEYEDNT